MNQQERTKLTEMTLAAIAITKGHLEASNRGLDPASVRSAIKYAEIALANCRQLEAALPENQLPKSYVVY